MARPAQRWVVWAGVVALGWIGSVAVRAQDDPAAPLAAGPALGVTLRGAAPAAPLSAPGREDLPFTVRVVARWSEIETEPGRYDWTPVESLVGWADERARIVLCLTGSHPRHVESGGPPFVEDGDSLAAWLEFVRRAARHFAGRVAVFEIRDRLGGPGGFDPSGYAFLLKSSALAVRAESEARGAPVGIAQAPVTAETWPWQLELWEQDVAPYIDVLPISFAASDPTDTVVATLKRALVGSLEHPPASALWAYAEVAGDASPGDAESLAVVALASGASAALVGLAPATPSGADSLRWVQEVHGRLGGYAPAPPGELRITDEAGNELREAQVQGRFFALQKFSTLVFYRSRGVDRRGLLVVDSTQVRNTRVIDPLSGEVRRVGSREAPGNRRAIPIEIAAHPRVALFERPSAPGGFDLPPEEVETTRTRELTAEEIIARYQEVQRVQDDRLDRWTARGRVDLHFKLAQGGQSVDVGIESNYFWERGGHLEWEQTDYFLNGNRLGWKKVPELPLIQPDKIVTLPLDLTLDRTYVYRLVGRARVEGRPAYELEFRPSDPAAALSLYRGRVWIDVERFVRVKLSVVQTNLKPPVLSHEETDWYTEITGPDGNGYWLPTRIAGQEIWKAAGRNFVIRREQRFNDVEINPPRDDFAERRAAAYASRNQMLRDAEAGIRYLDRQDDGTRILRTEEDTGQLFAAAGAFKDQSTDGVTPLGGVNYFNYNLFGKNIQLNAFFAGVLGFLTASDPDLFGGRLDGTVDATLAAIKFEDEIFLGQDELVLERIETRSQNVSAQLGIPAGAFWKLNLVGGVSFRQYFQNDDAAVAREEFNTMSGGTQFLDFVLPEDHVELKGRVELEFNRRGYSLSAFGSWAERSEWNPWGMVDTVAGTFVRFDPVTGDYVSSDAPLEDKFQRWGLSGFKEWYLPKFQKLRGEVNYLDGSDLDRFSRYQFSLFGDDRLNGFSGSGVRFDEGLIARAGYSFNLFEILRFDAGLETARIEERDSGIGAQNHTGFGLSTNFVMPWKTVVSFSWGYALNSDVPALEGEQEFLLLVLKLF